MLAYIFPGQGAQVVGMGKDLLNDFITLERKASEILGYSLKELCLQDSQKVLSKTQYTQPALFTVNALTYIKQFEDTDTEPNYLAGHSLGEYNALFAAGVFNFETGIRLVQKRGQLMAQATGGAMAAIIGPELSKAIDIVQQLAPEIDVANHNTDVQVVLSGPADGFEKVQPALEAAGYRVIRLAVSASFHSRYMQKAAQEFRDFLNTVDIQPPRMTVIANVTAKPYPKDPEQIKDILAQQIMSPVLWSDSVRYLRRESVQSFKELGPGNVLTNMLANIS